jgi:hypothetical protein
MESLQLPGVVHKAHLTCVATMVEGACARAGMPPCNLKHAPCNYSLASMNSHLLPSCRFITICCLLAYLHSYTVLRGLLGSCAKRAPIPALLSYLHAMVIADRFAHTESGGACRAVRVEWETDGMVSVRDVESRYFWVTNPRCFSLLGPCVRVMHVPRTLSSLRSRPCSSSSS